ncbi:MAG: hypothetical protein ACPGVO_22475 [Spirulinaceae cyanobacterium]
MQLPQLPQTLWRTIKLLSASLIVAALALELWHQYANRAGFALPAILTPLFGIERLVLLGHLIEAGLAIALSLKRSHNALTYGIYTFFVGFVGLVELFEPAVASEAAEAADPNE